ncbi:DUF4142 domain-containing protein [Sphingobium subterraneum]|uniref:Putative outer membrane protein n=1 Tax=Sphingobium subterraneum TaxID=627688 RepID=A0A841J7P4_9SPHN|nr:DUF4142 domain-containing protein [Sphingobium subterraneum]MBB6124201.1 putative outer membrane protein [Sphingobium subterraneum]
MRHSFVFGAVFLAPSLAFVPVTGGATEATATATTTSAASYIAQAGAGDLFEIQSSQLAQQKRAHQMALDLHQSYGTPGDRPALKQVAAKAVPIVEKHIVALKAL